VLKFLARNTQSPAAFDGSAAEVVTYDPATKMAIVTDLANNKLSFISIANPAAPAWQFDVLMAPYGGFINSVSAKNGLVAVCLDDATSKLNPGKVVIFDNAGGFRSLVTVGALPDMLTFTPDGKTIVVANEGEPSADYSQDPNGSVSIINVTTPTAPTVQSVSFTGLNGKEDSLRHLGLRIYGPFKNAAQDFEPEYVAISPDGKTAYVTLQEANGIAVIDIATATLTRVVALGYKDYSRGLPTCKTYSWTNRPLLGTTPKGQNILLGGFSGLWYVGPGSGPDTYVFLTHPDRGPNGEPSTLRGQPRRPFALPNMQAEIVRFELNTVTGAFTVLNRLKLWRKDGITPITGLPNLQAAGQGIAYTDEYAVDLYGNDVANDPLGADMEGIVVDANGTYWMVDEYRPAIYNFDVNGVLIERYIPLGTAAAGGKASGFYGQEVIPAVYAQRRSNRGFEAVAIDAPNNLLYAFIQSPIDNPDVANDATSKASNWCRIVVMNTATKQIVGEYLYPMHEKAGAADKIGDAVFIGNGRFNVVERDDATGLRARKYIFEINLKGATNIYTNPPVLAPGETIEGLTFAQLYAKGVRPVHKRKVVYLPAVGYGQSEKVEGLAMIDANTFAVINDNDFGVGGSTLPNPPDGSITVNPNAPEYVGIIKFDRPNGLDPSDKDNANLIGNWPVFGMYEPDAIAVADINGETVLLTANEGDARDPALEEFRAKDLLLDASLTSAWPNLQADANLGRLNVTNRLGDLDGDGDFDQLYTLGGRGFSIWNLDGNLLWDSGSEFETRTAGFFPNNFNSGHTNNTRDDRSDNKGPEPEGITVGKINNQTYAFVVCERISGTFMYDISNVVGPQYVDYINSRNFAVSPSLPNIQNGTVGDLGPEVPFFIDAATSPNGNDILLTSNEVSGTLSIYSVRVPRIVSSPAAVVNVCSGEVLTLTVTATGPNLTYQWFKDNVAIPLATSRTYTTTASLTTTPGSYKCSVTADGGMTVTPTATQVNVFKRTIIETQPKRLTQVDNDVTVVLNVKLVTTESGETFQWYKAGVALTDNAKYKGTKTNALTIFFTQFADTSSYYYCIITGGCATVRTQDASVQIPRINITQQPVGLTLCPGADAVFTCAALPTGGDAGLRYQWKLPQGGFLVNSARIQGAESPTLKILGVKPEDSETYVCLITGVPSLEPLHTNQVRLIVRETPVIIDQPVNINGSNIFNICEGSHAVLKVFAEGVGLRYQWLKNGAPILGATESVYHASTSGTYRVRVLGECIESVAESEQAIVNVLVRPLINTGIPYNLTVRHGGTFTFNVTLKAGSPVIRYQWYQNGVAIPNATSSTFTVNNAQKTAAGEYFCLVSNDCGNVESNRCVVVVQDPVSVEEGIAGSIEMRVDPQPLKSQGMVRFTLPADGQGKLTVVDAQGRTIYTLAEGILQAGDQAIAINTAVVPATGAYFIRLEYAGSVTTVPVIIAD
jgi:sugar lactone lactonase YvrE